jgi:hypothetical protein
LGHEQRSNQPEKRKKEKKTKKEEIAPQIERTEEKKHHFPIKLKETIAEVRTRHRLTKVSIELLVNPERVEDDCETS